MKKHKNFRFKMSQNTNKTQLAIIGGGPGGYAAAFLASDLGLEVTLIDKAKNPGGSVSLPRMYSFKSFAARW